MRNENPPAPRVTADGGVRFRILVIAWVLGSIALFVGAFQSRFNLSNIDGVSYMSIARQYAEGHGAEAINAYWSPMVSWLMAPFIGAGVSPILAFDLINAVFAAAGVALITWFVWKRTAGNFWASALTLFIAGVFYVGDLFVLTPDILVTTWIILFVSVLVWLDVKLDAATTRQIVVGGAILGAVCTFGYLIKLFLVPVFVVVIVAWLLLRVLPARSTPFRARARATLVAVVSAAVVTVVLSAPWATTLSIKYQEFTVGSSFAVNVGTKFAPTAAEKDANSLKLYAPPNRYAVSFGEDRTNQAEAGGATVKSSITARAVYYAKQRLTAFPFYVSKIGSIAPFAVLIMVAFLVFLVFVKGGLARWRPEIIISITFWVYFLGYAAITSAASGGGNSRYYWPMLVLSTLLFALIIPSLWRVLGAPTSRLRAITFIVIVAIVPAAVVWQNGLGKAAPFSTAPGLGSVGYLVSGGKVTPNESFSENQLAKIIPPHSKIVGSDYRVALQYAYYLNSQIYGRAAQGYNIEDPRFQQVLRDNGIDYYLLFTPVGTTPRKTTDLGPTVAAFSQRNSCSDAKTALIVDCLIQVVKLR